MSCNFFTFHNINYNTSSNLNSLTKFNYLERNNIVAHVFQRRYKSGLNYGHIDCILTSYVDLMTKWEQPIKRAVNEYEEISSSINKHGLTKEDLLFIWANYLDSDIPQPKEGAHCKWCAAKPICPKHEKSIIDGGKNA